MDDELPSDEEEILVYVEFDGSIPGNTFSNEKLHLDMIGLDNDNPIMQINGKFYEGTYQDAVGTYMFFKKDKNPTVDDPVFDSVPSLKYYAKTRKVLKMNRIFVEAKNEMLGDSNDTEFLPNMESIKKAGVPPRYQEAALKTWETMRDNRMDALNRYLEKQRIRKEKRDRGIEPDSESDYDNPFSMYKPEGGEDRSRDEEWNATNEDLYSSDSEEGKASSKEDEDRDHEPSTSKNSKPWTSPSSRSQQNDCDETDPKNGRAGKNKITVKVGNKEKPQKKSSKLDKKSKKMKNVDAEEENEDCEPETMALMRNEMESLLDSCLKDKKKVCRNNSTELSKNPPKSSSETVEELKSNDADLKLTKQQKREEKMRLVSERFKKAAEEKKSQRT